MTRTTLLKVLAILFAFALIAAACGDDDDDDNGASDDTTDQTDDGDTTDDGTTDDGDAAGTVPDNPDEGVTSDTIKVGWMGDITGPTASFQAFGNHGSVAYVECLNERGGVLGRNVELISEDDQFGAEQGQINYTKLVDDDNVLAILYMGNTAIAEALLPDVEDAGIAVIGPPQTTDALADSEQFFTNLAHYGDQADMIVPEMAQRVGGAENMVVFGISFEVPSGR